MKSQVDISTTFKLFVTLASAYVFGFGLLYGWAYWSAFSVDFLSYVSLADVIRLALLPLSQVVTLVFGNSIALSIATALATRPSTSSGEKIIVPTTRSIERAWMNKFASFLMPALLLAGIIAAFPAGCSHANSVKKESPCVHPKFSPKDGCYRFEGVLGGTYFFLMPHSEATLVLGEADALPLEIPISDQKPWWIFPGGGGGPGPVSRDESPSQKL